MELLLSTESAPSAGRTIGTDGRGPSACSTSSLFFFSVRKNTVMVVRRGLFGLQSSADSGVCSQTGHEAGSVDWPTKVSVPAQSDYPEN